MFDVAGCACVVRLTSMRAIWHAVQVACCAYSTANRRTPPRLAPAPTGGYQRRRRGDEGIRQRMHGPIATWTSIHGIRVEEADNHPLVLQPNIPEHPPATHGMCKQSFAS